MKINPTGVDLVTGALPRTSPHTSKQKKIAYGFATIPFPDGWKANIRGVDLNRSFQQSGKKLVK